MTKKYKKIEKFIGTLPSGFFTGSLNEILTSLEEIYKNHPNFTNFYIKEGEDNSKYNFDYSLFGVRKETDQERDKRLAKVKKQRIAQKKRREKEAKELEARERKEYEKLKAKFEKD